MIIIIIIIIIIKSSGEKKYMYRSIDIAVRLIILCSIYDIEKKTRKKSAAICQCGKQIENALIAVTLV